MIDPVIQTLVVIGSASVHTWRYLTGIAPFVGCIYLVCNQDVPANRRPSNLAGVLKVDFRLSSFSTVGKVRNWLETIRPDVVHIHQANSVAWHGLRACRGLGIPTVLTAWGSDVLLLPERNAFMSKMVRSNLLAADVVTSDSLYMAAKIRQLAGEKKRIEILNYGIDHLPDTCVVDGKRKMVLSCRLHKPLYRIDAILRAWQVVESQPHAHDWELVVAANGDETENLKTLAQALGLARVRFVGFVNSETLNQYYAQSRVFVSVPESDATSISLLEAMAHGNVPVLSNLPANLEWVIDDLNGFIVEDIDRLGETLSHAITEAEQNAYLQQLADLNRGLVKKKAVYQTNMAAFAAIYQTLCPKSC